MDRHGSIAFLRFPLQVDDGLPSCRRQIRVRHRALGIGILLLRLVIQFMFTEAVTAQAGYPIFGPLTFLP